MYFHTYLQITALILIRAINLYEIILFIRILLSWLPDIEMKIFMNPIGRVLFFITDPFLEFFRRWIPIRLWYIDFSPVFAFLFLELLVWLLRSMFF